MRLSLVLVQSNLSTTDVGSLIYITSIDPGRNIQAYVTRCQLKCHMLQASLQPELVPRHKL